MNAISHFFIATAVAVFVCCRCPVKNHSSVAFGAESQANQKEIERYYFVKGMNCGGCVFGVKNSLKKAGLDKNQIIEVDHSTPDPANNIGHAKVKFPADQYKGITTDCKVAKQIRDDLGYSAYWDKSNSDPCGLEKKGN